MISSHFGPFLPSKLLTGDAQLTALADAQDLFGPPQDVVQDPAVGPAVGAAEEAVLGAGPVRHQATAQEDLVGAWDNGVQ